MKAQNWFVCGFIGLGMVFAKSGEAHSRDRIDPHFQLGVRWASQGTSEKTPKSKELGNWSLTDLEALKQTSSREKDPLTGKVVKWEGVLLSHFIEKILVHLPNEEKAQIDLVVLKNRSEKSALIPRALVNKYPILLAFHSKSESGKDVMEERGPLFSVVPWTSKPKIQQEDLPLESYFLPQIVQIELTNYRNQYSSLFLRRRTDPSAMRGEKLFVQNCVGCHVEGLSSRPSGVFVSARHPNTIVTEKLSDRDRRSILRYLEAHRMEQGEVGATRSSTFQKFFN